MKQNKKIIGKNNWEYLISISASLFSIFSLTISITFSMGSFKEFSMYTALGLAMIASVMSIYILRRKTKSIKRFDPLKEKKVFLSYVRQDKEKVQTIYFRLKELGLNPWMDLEDLKPGDLWSDKIDEAIKSSDFVLLCFSQNSISKKGFVTKEIDAALKRYYENEGRSPTFLIPIKLDESSIPVQLSMFQYVDLTSKLGWDSLIKTIKEKFDLQK
jgi:hypothetical protein